MIAPWPKALQWGVLLVMGAAMGWLFQQLDIPAGLMLGPLLVAGAFGMQGASVRVARPCLVFAQAVLGYLIAQHMDVGVVVRAAEIWPTILLFVALTFAASCAIGLLAARLTGIDREVSIWGFLPGMAGTVILMAQEQGLDSRMVAFIQVLRLLVVIGSMTLLAGSLIPEAAPLLSEVAGFDPFGFGAGLGVLGCGFVAAFGLKFIPGGATLVPLVVACALGVMGVDVALPNIFIIAAFLTLGLQVGLRLTPDLMRKGWAALPMLLLTSGLLIGFCAVSGAILAWVAQVDLLSALLATVPGSVETISVIAIAAHADVSFVMTLQTVRLFAVALLGPWVASYVIRLLRAQG